MRTTLKSTHNQMRIIESKLQAWISLRSDQVPPSGWIKAIRGALGIRSRQIADALGVDHSVLLRLEAREANKKVTLELLEKVAEVMDCKLVYAIVPKDGFSSLDAIVEKRAMSAARQIIEIVEHSMRLEGQGSPIEHNEKRISELALELKNRMDPRIWGSPKKKKRSKSQVK
jgi:predicted DNA-binding mobile mystery protein A